jgi:adenylate kinase
VSRSDDNAATLVKRLSSYHKQTAPVAAYYKKRGILKEVDAAQSQQVVSATLDAIFAKLR